MSLEVRHNRAEHTHENEQFRRVASSLRILFEQNAWDGLLIGNPFSESFTRLRADAFLLYNHGLIIIDFKDYSGTICLPSNEADFKSSKWYSESLVDKQRIVIKAGSKFINPFMQLQTYRNVMSEVIQSNIYLKGFINPSRTLALNIFSGPIQLQNKVPRSIPYYKIVQESDLPTLLYDFSSENSYSDDLAKAFNAQFNAELWLESLEIIPMSHKATSIKEIGSDVKSELSKFLAQDSSGILVLESMDIEKRDDWMRYVLSEAIEFNIPQTETWAHSSRIVRKIGKRTGITLQSLYSTIYGGAASENNDSDKSNDSGDKLEEEQSQEVLKDAGAESNEEHLQEIVGLRSDESLDSAAVVILHEAHLVTRSLHQSELLKFGTGRLLEDLISFLRFNAGKRKLICIGDPYSLTYGKAEESALNLAALRELYDGEISHYREPLSICESSGRLLFRNNIATQIEKGQFNKLEYPWSAGDLIETDKVGISSLLKEWFSAPCDSEPQKTVMVYSNKQKNAGARDINVWIKRNCLKNGDGLAINDLLLINNNINIPDPTGFGQPTKLYNGMYLLVKDVGDIESVPIRLRINKTETKVNLRFIKLKVVCLSVHDKPLADVWLLHNYFISDDHLSKEEQIAFRIFVNTRVKEEEGKRPFDKSFQSELLGNSVDYKETLMEAKALRTRFEKGESVKGKAEKAERKIHALEVKARKRHRQSLLADIIGSDPLVNAIHASHGWAITVHKAVGSSFSHTILNTYQGETKGIKNLEYFRWLYTAVTSTAGLAYVVNPKLIHPLMECEFEDSSPVSEKSKPHDKSKLIYDDYVIEDQYKGKFPEGLKSNVIGAICEFTKLIEWDGLILESVRSNGDYLTKAQYTSPNQVNRYLNLAIHNKGEKDGWAVTAIKIEKSSGVITSQINEAVARLFDGQRSDSRPIGIIMPDDFRRDIYLSWENSLKKDSYSLKLIQSHQYQDVFEVQNADSHANFRVYYNGHGFFTRFTVFEKSDETISEKLSNLVTKCRQNLN